MTAVRMSAGRTLSAPGPVAPHETRRPFLALQLGRQTYALPAADVREIVLMAALSRPPGLPPVLAGFLNLGGRAVPVVCLARLFRLGEPAPGLYTPVVVLRAREDDLALTAERVSHVFTAAAGAVLPLPGNHAFNDCVEGLVSAGGPLVPLLSPGRLLLEKERQCLAELQDREQERLRALGGDSP